MATLSHSSSALGCNGFPCYGAESDRDTLDGQYPAPTTQVVNPSAYRVSFVPTGVLGFCSPTVFLTAAPYERPLDRREDVPRSLPRGVAV